MAIMGGRWCLVVVAVAIATVIAALLYLEESLLETMMPAIGYEKLTTSDDMITFDPKDSVEKFQAMLQEAVKKQDYVAAATILAYIKATNPQSDGAVGTKNSGNESNPEPKAEPKITKPRTTEQKTTEQKTTEPNPEPKAESKPETAAPLAAKTAAKTAPKYKGKFCPYAAISGRFSKQDIAYIKEIEEKREQRNNGICAVKKIGFEEDCGHRNFNLAAWKALFKDRRVGIIGDSVIMNIHDYLYTEIFGKSDQDLFQYRQQFEGQWWVNPNCCTSPEGNVTFVWEGEYCATCDVMLVNSFGLWALMEQDEDKVRIAYTKRLDKMAAQFCSWTDKTILWMGTSFLTEQYLKVPEVEVNKQPMMKERNGELLREMEREKIESMLKTNPECNNIVYLDVAHVQSQRPDCSYDGKHYVKKHFQWYIAEVIANGYEQYLRRRKDWHITQAKDIDPKHLLHKDDYIQNTYWTQGSYLDG